MKIIFVGIHYKDKLTPLCSSTKSGKLIDRIIKELPLKKVEIVKTNLYDHCAMPNENDKFIHAIEWYDKNSVHSGLDIAVLLGREVQKHFNRTSGITTIDVPHPAGIFGKKKQFEYVLNVSNRIMKKIEQLTK